MFYDGYLYRKLQDFDIFPTAYKKKHLNFSTKMNKLYAFLGRLMTQGGSSRW